MHMLYEFIFEPAPASGSIGARSASGQSRRFDPLPVPSGLPRTTDINRPAPFGPVRVIRFRNGLSLPSPLLARWRHDGRNAGPSVEAYWRFAAVCRATSYPAEPPEQTCTNVNDLDRETLILLEFSGRVLRS